MKPAVKPVLWAGALVAVGLLTVVLLRQGTPENPGIAAPVSSAPETGAAPPAPVVPAGHTAEPPPPWMNNGAPGTAAAATVARQPPAVFGGRQPTRAELAQALLQIREKAAQNDRAANELLRQLDAMQASGKLPPNINAEALRNNLLIAKRTQELAREMGDLVAAPAGTDTQPRMNAIIAELQQLKSQLRYDVNLEAAAVSTAATPGRTQ
ncbi:hypothetical protein [Stenotrophomonas nitritireducens]|uniref:hypothetical protein n=1 Tax=Stenotrophomonas nitritireducens TaxID=83617 RepID=UPI003D977AA6